MKKNIGLISAVVIALTFLLLSFTSLPYWVQAKSEPQNERGSVLYVSSSGSGGCTSWADACSLRVGLTTAITTDEIWVKAGTYLPTAIGDRAVSFSLKSGVAVYGGFAGTETLRDQRDWEVNPTILSGDIGVVGDNSDNSYQVIYNNGITATTLLDGFTITAGNADGASTAGYGGGMFNTASSPTLTNVTFSSNSATYGGGMRNLNSSPTLTNVTFSSNSSSFLGGGMHNSSSSPSLTNVTFSSNSVASGDGGGMYSNTSSSPILTDVTFSGNTATQSGGGICTVINSSATLTNVTFSGNSAHYGGGMYTENSSATLTNVTFSGNAATLLGGGMYNYNSNPTLTNAILWGNTPNQIYNNTSTPVITYSDIQEGYTGEGNINLDPLLGPLADNGGFTQTHALLPGSPAIDTGSPTICPATDQRGFYRPTDGNSDENARCDMGAYEAHQIIFVDKDALGLNSGTSWSNAFTTLQAALAITAEGDEIWVADGTYLPTDTTDRTISFQLKDGVAIYGGFAGIETEREQRNWLSNITILSGDIGVPDDTSDNSYHVLYGTGINTTAILDGFTITAGNADGNTWPFDSGGGMYNFQSSPTLTNVTFSTNSATYGGGMYNYDSSSPTLVNVTFSGNSANYGGGIYNDSSSPMLTSATISANSAIISGGGMYNWDHSDPTLTNVTFSTNSASYGAGMFNYTSSPTLSNVTFSGNTASIIGGGLYNYEGSPAVINGILWANTPDQIYDDSSTPVVTYSDIEGGYTGEGNINVDPLLGPLADNGGFTLTHALLAGSPAIDTGNLGLCPTSDQRGIVRPIDGDWDWVPGCDMGAYEYKPVIYTNYLPLIIK